RGGGLLPARRKQRKACRCAGKATTDGEYERIAAGGSPHLRPAPGRGVVVRPARAGGHPRDPRRGVWLRHRRAARGRGAGGLRSRGARGGARRASRAASRVRSERSGVGLRGLHPGRAPRDGAARRAGSPVRQRPRRRAAAVALGAGAALLGFLGTGQNSDLLAHLFGFCAGALAALAAGRLVLRPPPRSAWQPALGAATLAAVAVAWWFALRR